MTESGFKRSNVSCPGWRRYTTLYNDDPAVRPPAGIYEATCAPT
ncbi:hypothetical protein [Leptothermofonsia sichuanensis]|nr:hypothetical protein [Leptothermofonsia sichuanensis]